MKRFQKILAYCPDRESEERVLDWSRVIAARSEPQLVTLVRVVEEFLPEYPAELSEEEFLESEREALGSEAAARRLDAPTEVKILVGDPLRNLLTELSDGSYDLVIVPVNGSVSRAFVERLTRKSPVVILIVPPDTEPHFRHILMGVDFSGLSEMTLELAQAFSSLSNWDRDLKALHVTHMPNDSRATLAVSKDALRGVMHDSTMTSLQGFLRDHAEEPELWTPMVAENPLAGVQIVKEANKNKVDLIVIGAHGRGAFSIGLLGTAASDVIRESKRPILIVKRKNKSLGFLRNLLGLPG